MKKLLMKIGTRQTHLLRIRKHQLALEIRKEERKTAEFGTHIKGNSNIPNGFV